MLFQPNTLAIKNCQEFSMVMDGMFEYYVFG